MSDEKEDTSPEGIVKEAKERFQLCEKTFKTTRLQAIEDTRFCLGDSDNNWQWPEEVRRPRQFDKKVCLTVNHTAQHVNNIVNQIRQNRPACRILPSDKVASKDTAEILAGLIRNIQSNSAADDAHDIAAEHACIGGEGYWRIITEFESDTSFDQIIKIKAISNPQLVYVDPNAKEPDKSDAEWGFVFEDVPNETIEREYKGVVDPTSWIVDKKTRWTDEDTSRIAEYFWCEWVKDTALFMEDGQTTLESDLGADATRQGNMVVHASGASMQIVKERETFIRKWYWCKLIGGEEKPVDMQEWPGEFLPIVKVVGKETNVDGEIIIKGIVRDLKDPARMVNYAYSETIQTLALQNKIPYMAAAEAIEGYEEIWKGANLENRAYLPFNATDEQGRPLPVPQRQAPPVMPQAQVQLLQISTEEMRAASGQQNANFGQKSEASSGIGIQRLKQQGEIATFHFPDNLSRALRYEAKVLIDLIQKIYDTKRVVHILGLDGKQSQATLDPNHPQPYSEWDIGEEDIQKIFNPQVGMYDVVIDTGPSFQTQRQEAFASLSDIAAKNPQIMGVAGDLIMRAADFPMAEQLADRLQKTLPPGLQDEKTGADQQVAQLTQQAQQMQQALQQMQQQLQEAQQKLQIADSGQAKAQMEIQAKTQLAQTEQSLIDQRKNAEIEAQRERILMEDKLKREQAILDAHLADTKAQQDADLELRIAKMKIQSAEEIAELNAFVELEKAKIVPPPALSAEVNGDLAEDAKETSIPKLLKRKISMMAPSGGTYTGTIEDV